MTGRRENRSVISFNSRSERHSPREGDKQTSSLNDGFSPILPNARSMSGGVAWNKIAIEPCRKPGVYSPNATFGAIFFICGPLSRRSVLTSIACGNVGTRRSWLLVGVQSAHYLLRVN
jgi:hypothetical protein